MNLLKKLIVLIIIGASLVVGLGFLGKVHPAFDTLSHFRLHLSVGLIFIGMVLGLREWQRTSLLALIVGAIGFYTSASGTILTNRILQADTSKPIYSLLHFNLFWINERQEDVIDKIIELDPELISLSEASKRWALELKRLDEKWPHSIHCTEWANRGGIRFYSKWPLSTSTQYCAPYGAFAKTEVISPEGIKFISGSVHLRWPWPASGPKQLETIIPELRKIGSDALLAGDYNATTWSYSVKKFAEASGMNIIPGLGSTWMLDEFPLRYTWWAGLPIDNVMQKGRIKVLSAKTLEELGSDHLPVFVEFQIQ